MSSVAIALIASLLVLPGCAELSSGNFGGTQSTSTPSPSDGKPATAGPSGAYAVTLGVKNNAGRLGAIQFTARARGAGSWQGAGANVACTNLTGRSMHACNGNGSELSCGLIDTNGISTPTDLVTCTFKSSAAVSSVDFSVQVVDATNTATKPVKADVVVTKVTAK
jgi:hypothetical protein